MRACQRRASVYIYICVLLVGSHHGSHSLGRSQRSLRRVNIALIPLFAGGVSGGMLMVCHINNIGLKSLGVGMNGDERM